ncbi:MAG: PAS domain S-box protein [Desulfobacter sp.]|nr:MAG: PAS domain S-box protein [Desulfobacter sp.]
MDKSNLNSTACPGIGSAPLFQMMMDNAPDMIWAKDLNNRYLFANRAICDTLLKCGSPEDVVGKDDLYFAEGERKRGYLHTFGDICVDSDEVVKESRKAGSFIEEGFVRGRYLILDVHKAPLYNDAGEMVGTVGSARDITEQRAMELKLKKSEARFRQMADFLPLPIVEVDFELNLSYINRTGLAYFGYTREEAEQSPEIKNRIPRERLGTVFSWMERLRQGVEVGPFENHFVKKDGTRVFGVVHAAPIREDGEVVAIRACFTDLTRRHEVEMALGESERRFRTLFNVITDAVFVHPFSGEGFLNFVEVNNAASGMYGYTREEFLAMSPWELIPDTGSKSRIHTESRAALEKKGKRVAEYLHIRKNNEIFPVELSSCLFEFHGKTMILSTVRDITDRRRSEKEREDAVKFAAEQEKYALVGQVAGKMAHDFNNILGGIMGNAELSLIDCRDEAVKSTLGIILEQTLRGRNLTRNLVAFARDQEPKEEFFDINEKLALVLSLMKKDLEGVAVSLKLAPDLPDLLADPGMIEHALVNLIQNSVHAMGKQPHPRMVISTAHLKKGLSIEIRDNGCGIPARFHDRIYAPSFTLKGSKDLLGHYHKEIRGTGYGMANVKKYIQKHRGRIRFTSKEGEGTCFVITIPLVNKELTRREKRRMENKQVVQNRKILLVEDEPDISGVQEKILTQAPFFHEVRVSADGQAALEALDREDFDLVSLDYLLPGRLNGMDIYTHIRRNNPDIPVIFLSGNMEFIESIKEISARDSRVAHLIKPCQNIVYADTINAWLAGDPE